MKPKYSPSDLEIEQMKNNFKYHPPEGDQVLRYEAIRDDARIFARFIVEQVPVSRERSLALTKLEECVMWANAGIARNEEPE